MPPKRFFHDWPSVSPRRVPGEHVAALIFDSGFVQSDRRRRIASIAAALAINMCIALLILFTARGIRPAELPETRTVDVVLITQAEAEDASLIETESEAESDAAADREEEAESLPDMEAVAETEDRDAGAPDSQAIAESTPEPLDLSGPISNVRAVWEIGPEQGSTEAVLNTIFCLSSGEANREIAACPSGPNADSAALAAYGTMPPGLAAQFGNGVDAAEIRAMFGVRPPPLAGEDTLAPARTSPSLAASDSMRESLPSSSPDPSFPD